MFAAEDHTRGDVDMKGLLSRERWRTMRTTTTGA
jgi:hypothetical protein